MSKKIFMKPGRTNQEDRENFIKFWVKYMKVVSDDEWSNQQNIIINSQLQGADHQTYLAVKGAHRKNPLAKR